MPKEALAKEGDTKCSYMYSFKNRPGGVLLGGETSNIFYFHPYLGKIPILTNIFRRG